MSYRYLDNVATADVAFEVRARSLSALVVESGEALMHTMVEKLETIHARERRRIVLSDAREDMLLFQALQEQIFFKDAHQLLLRLRNVRIARVDGLWRLEAEAYGEKMDLHRHEMLVDVKAVTLHRFSVTHDTTGWRAMVVVDI